MVLRAKTIKALPDHLAADDVDSLSNLGFFTLPQAAGQTLMSMAASKCVIYAMSRPVLNTAYANNVHVSLKSSNTQEDGLGDSVRQVLLSCNPYDQYILSLLRKSF